MTTREWHESPSVSIDADSNHRVQFTVWTDVLNGEAFRFVLEPHEALGLLAQLANHAGHCATRAAQTIQAGDCPTCKNMRLIEVPAPGGRMSNDHCPDCRATLNAAYHQPFARPRIGGGIA